MKDFEIKKRKKMIERMVGGGGGSNDCGKGGCGGSCKTFRVKENTEELNFIDSLTYFLLLIIIGSIIIVKIIFPVVQRAVDIEALNTCEMRGDCAEVIKDINN